MTTTSVRAGALACALLATTCLSVPALAQSASTLPAVHKTVDTNGVDLTDGSFNFSIIEGSIGTGEGALSVVRTNGRAGWTDELPGKLHRTLSTTNNKISVVFGSRVEFFTLGANGWTPDKADGATLEGSGSDYTYRSADGTVVTYGVGEPLPGPSGGSGIQFCIEGEQTECDLLPLSVRKPSGRQIALQWEIAQISEDLEPTIGGTYNYYPRLSSVSNEAGYAINFIYATDSYGSEGPSPDWFRRTGARFVNQAVSATDWPTVSYAQPASGVTDVTDTAGRTWRFTEASGSLAIRRPGSATDNIVVTKDASGKVSQINADGVTTSYAYSDSGSTRTTTVTNALNQQTVVTSDLNLGRVTSVRDALNRTAGFTYDANGRLTRTTAPEGNYVEHTLDARGNATQTRAVAKPGSGLADIVSSASFAASCTNALTCNKPISTTNARGHTTDYAYDPTHGGLVSATLPAPAAGAVRPQTRYGYTQISGVHLLTSTSACQTQGSCAGTADEVKTSIAYDSAKLHPVSTSSGAGDGSLTATSVMAYDRLGNLLTVDGPLAGSADTIRYRYDAARQLVGTVSSDPDGSGALQHRAQRTTYRPDGQVEKVESGTTTDQSDSAWANFASLETAETSYDGNNRPVISRLVAGGQVHALTQTSYDALGRVECVVTRMNPAAYSSLPSSACSLGSEGSFGPDRISRTSYNAAGQVIEVRAAVGTPDEAVEAATSYRPNGQAETLTDGEGNRTTYVFDGHDRLLQTHFPVATKGANTSNPNDYEELAHDAGGNVTSKRVRDGQVIGYSFDALGRLTFKNLPNTSTYEQDVSFGYDLLGRLTSASDNLGHQQTFGYDALGRRLSEASNWYGTTTSQYDPAGRRTRLNWRDAFYVTYEHLTTGEMSAIRENGGFVLASFGYDDRGRRTTLSRGNGTVTSYGYDAVSRLSGLTHDLGGTASDLQLTFSHNPAGQIASNTRSNDAYAWTGTASGTTGSTVNGLNQLTQSGSATLTHDGRGNMTSNGVSTFGFTVENKLTSGQTSNQYYDPLGRLAHVSGGATDLLYDGQELIQEIEANGGPTRRRYVHGPGTDEALIWYEGAGTSDRRYLHTDERGSVVAVSDGGGALIGVNKYDEYGAAAASNVGAFGYTGQVWIAELGLWHYKARAYDPRLGRFLQTDPIGYGDGLNMYAYAAVDPVNRRDPTGLCNEDGTPRYEGENCDPIVVTGKPQPQVGISRDPGGFEEIVVSGRRNGEPEDEIQLACAGPFIIPCGKLLSDGLTIILGGSIILSDHPQPLMKTDKPKTQEKPKKGGGGEHKIHNVTSPTRGRARDRAVDNSARGQAPIEHSNPATGDPHFHAVDARGKKKPGVHYNYPRR